MSRIQRMAHTPIIEREYALQRSKGKSPQEAAAEAITCHDRGWHSSVMATTATDPEAIELASILEVEG